MRLKTMSNGMYALQLVVLPSLSLGSIYNRARIKKSGERGGEKGFFVASSKCLIDERLAVANARYYQTTTVWLRQQTMLLRQTALDRQDSPCTHLDHHKLESAYTIDTQSYFTPLAVYCEVQRLGRSDSGSWGEGEQELQHHGQLQYCRTHTSCSRMDSESRKLSLQPSKMCTTLIRLRLMYRPTSTCMPPSSLNSCICHWSHHRFEHQPRLYRRSHDDSGPS